MPWMPQEIGNTQEISGCTTSDAPWDSLDAQVRTEYKASDLSDRCEELHEEVYRKLLEVMPLPFRKRTAYEAELPKGEKRVIGESLPGRPFVLVDTEISSLNRFSSIYDAFRTMNRNDALRPEDLFEAILIHEYGHQLFEEFYEQRVTIIYATHNTHEMSRSVRAVGEAFSFWLEEELTGTRHMYEETAETYSDTADVKALKFFYDRFKEEARRKGRQYMLENLHAIVEENVWKVKDVRLLSVKNLGRRTPAGADALISKFGIYQLGIGINDLYIRGLSYQTDIEPPNYQTELQDYFRLGREYAIRQ